MRNLLRAAVCAALFSGLCMSAASANSANRPGNDIDGDGKSDVLFYNKTTGQFTYWIMDGADVVRKKSMNGPGIGFDIKAIGDFNRDNKLDIVWSSVHGDETVMWLGNGRSYISKPVYGVEDLNLNLQGAADFDGDGKSDLISRYGTRSEHYYLYFIMDGENVVRQGRIDDSDVYGGYSIAGAADFDGDGDEELVARETDLTNGRYPSLYLWSGIGTSKFESVKFGHYSSGDPVRVGLRGVTDLDGDSMPDLYFHDRGPAGDYPDYSAAAFKFRIMDGTEIVRRGEIDNRNSFGFPNHEWASKVAGDFDGDGKSEFIAPLQIKSDPQSGEGINYEKLYMWYGIEAEFPQPVYIGKRPEGSVLIRCCGPSSIAYQ